MVKDGPDRLQSIAPIMNVGNTASDGLDGTNRAIKAAVGEHDPFALERLGSHSICLADQNVCERFGLDLTIVGAEADQAEMPSGVSDEIASYPPDSAGELPTHESHHRYYEQSCSPNKLTFDDPYYTDPGPEVLGVPASDRGYINFVNLGAAFEFGQQVQATVEKLPENIRTFLNGHGFNVMATDTVEDLLPSLRDQAPRTYAPGATWANAEGTFRQEINAVVVAQQLLDQSGQCWNQTDRTEGVVRHEIGHAVDHYLGNYSDSAEFLDAYRQDVSQLSAEDRKSLRYLITENGTQSSTDAGHAGREETFAEVFAGLNGGTANAQQTAYILNKFPNVAALVQRKLATI